MATTWIKSLHVNKGKTIAQTLADRTQYAENPNKTEQGLFVTGFACDPRTADEQFFIAKRKYEYITGRNQGKHDVLAYHIRQSFKPGEIDAETANKIGYELAQRFFKGKHAYIVATHVDKQHIHNHIIVNSTTLDCERKFKDFKRSDRAVRRISDLLCVEYGLSVIERPKPSPGRNYGDWLGDDKPLSWSEKIRRQIDEILPDCKTFDEFLAALRGLGYTVNDNRKYVSVLAPGQKRAARLKTLGEQYTEVAIRARLGKEKVRVGGGDSGTRTQVSLLVDIQAKIREGKGAGYEQWAKIFNIKQAAKTLIYLQEQGIESYEDLKKKSSSASGEFTALNTKIKEVEIRQKEIAELQKYIGQYGKTREVYAAYKASGWSAKFFEEHRAEITLHKAAKKYFDELKLKKLPSINQLKQDYAALESEKKKLYSDYHALKENSRALAVAKHNADRLLGITPQAQAHDVSRDQSR
ncbi:hypothetical protein FACS1894208_02690 [Clostridia bacterium]|nr:hypothetical protein FACS1894208_02690 [Clostridia bacterium]